MRSPAEVAFRVRQEFANAMMSLSPPSAAPRPYRPLAALPDPEAIVSALAGGTFANLVMRLAQQIAAGHIELLGYTVQTGVPTAWRRDYVSGKETPPIYYRRIPYLEFDAVGDHKVIWELNRHQHLVVLAQAIRLGGRAEYQELLIRELSGWIGDNPFLRGINWTSALEVAFRTVSWIWIYHLAGGTWPADFQARFARALYQHGRYLEHNLSVYFSPNTHLLGEAVALHALGVLFPDFRRAATWAQTGRRIVLEQMAAQVRPDGSHFEQSSYYHVYALDMFLFHAALSPAPDWYSESLERMAEFLEYLLGPGRSIPLLGDDDGGRFFHPYGEATQFGRATLATAGALLNRPEWIRDASKLEEQACWWVGPRVLSLIAGQGRPMESKVFHDAGLAFLAAGDVQVIVDAGPFGPGSAGHSHSDTLSILARTDESEILVDSGTFTYVADAVLRDRFRGSAGHNTVRIDCLDQAIAAGSFRWAGPPRTKILAAHLAAGIDFIDAVCEYAGFRHRRAVWWVKMDSGPVAVIGDQVTAVSEQDKADHLVEQFWHAGMDVKAVTDLCYEIGPARIAFSPGAAVGVTSGGEHGWRSRILGQRAPNPYIHVARRTKLPVILAAVLDFRSVSKPLRVSVVQGDDLPAIQIADEAGMIFPLGGG